MKHTRSKRTLLSAMLAIAFVPCAALGMRLLMPNAQSASAESTNDTTHSGWTELTADTSALTDGNSYYLAGDTDLAADLTVEGRVTLCLNGHKLAGTGEGSVITVSEGADFTLCDCQSDGTDESNRHAYYVDENGLYKFDGAQTATGTIAGGVITGGNTVQGGGIYIDGAEFTMEGGTIAGNYAYNGNLNGRGGGVYGISSTFTLKGGTICGNAAAESGGGVALGNSETGACTFTMTGGTVANNQLSSDDPADPYFGGGIYASYSAVNINGGTISGNSAWGEYDTFGGGVSVEFGTFSMTGGVISGNEASCGGGISIFEAESAAITQADADVPAIISGNSAYSGGGIYADHAAFSMTGGTVSDNEAYGLGGGIYTYAVKLDLSGGSIDNNVAANGGGIYFTGDWLNYDNDYTLTVAENALIENNEATESGDIYGGGGIFADYAKTVMEGGAISNNTAGYGGGVLAYNTAVLTLKGGAVSGNRAENGGGIYAVEYAEVAISGGTVSGNTAEIDGGGILTEGDSALTMRSGTVSGNSARSGGGICLSNGTFKMSGGKIIGNTAQEYYYGGGVYAGISGIELSGSPVISGNTAGSIANDLEINRTTGNSIAVAGAFTNGAHIGVIDQQNKTMADFTSGYSAYNTADPADYFFADEKDHGVQLNENGEIEVVDGTYTVIFVGLDGTETSRTFDMGADITLDAVAAQEGCAGGWTTHEGGATIVYDGGQTVSGGLGSRHGQTIYLYEVQERGLGGDIDRITAGLTEAVEAVNTALEGGTATDLATALSDLADACKAADDALAADLAADLTELKNTLNAAEETIDAAIEGVKKDLGDAVTDLEGAMAAKADSAALAQAIDELTAAYTAADELMSADIDGIQADMSALEGRLDEALATLQESIHTMQTGLESETERLEGLINASGTDTAELKDALEALDAAYRAADGLLRTDLAAADEALAGEIAADIAELGATLESADEAVRDALDALRAEVDKNASGIAGLTAALWAVGAVAVIALCCAAAGIVLAVKAGKGKKSENGD